MILLQHLLSEWLIRKIFANPEFTRRNVIAAEVGKVIVALVSKRFNCGDFRKAQSGTVHLRPRHGLKTRFVRKLIWAKHLSTPSPFFPERCSPASCR
jgi:hypothetical protein